MELFKNFRVTHPHQVITLFYASFSAMSLLAAAMMSMGYYLFSPMGLSLTSLFTYLTDRPFQGIQLLALLSVLLLLLDAIAVILSQLAVARHWISLVWLVLGSSVLSAVFLTSPEAIIACYAIPAVSFGFCALYGALSGQNLARWHNLLLFSLVTLLLYGIFVTIILPAYCPAIPWNLARKLSVNVIIRRKALVLPHLLKALDLIFSYMVIPTVVTIITLLVGSQELKRLEIELTRTPIERWGSLLNQRLFFLFFKVYHFIRYPITKFLFALCGLPIDKQN